MFLRPLKGHGTSFLQGSATNVDQACRIHCWIRHAQAFFTLKFTEKFREQFAIEHTRTGQDKTVQNEDAPHLYPACYGAPGGSIRKTMPDE